MSQESAQVENAVETAPAEVLRITISDVLGLLAQGKSRKEIAEHYGRTQADMNKMVWGHPKLKNRKAKKQYTGIELEDDTEDINDVAGTVIEQAEPTVETVVNTITEDTDVPQVPSADYTTPESSTSDWN